MDEQISMFCAFTSGTPQQAQQYLALTDHNVEQAVELFFNSPDLGATAPTPSQPASQPSNANNPVTIDDDDGLSDVQETGSRPAAGASIEDDEAMARRLQEEMYGSRAGAGVGGSMGGDFDDEGVRAPMARTTETLVGPDASASWQNDPDEMQAAITEQLLARQNRARQPRAGIFNQREEASIWSSDDPNDPERHRQALSRATGGASDQTSKSTLLADLFRPPFDLISPISLSTARDDGKENEKWILVNVQDPSIFDCQILNRDIWKDASIKDTIKEHFIFLQYNKDDPRGQEYVNYYFSALRDTEDAYPHIAIVDPRTGEQVKTWSGSPAPKPADFLMELHEFLDRYSLRMDQKNPVQAKRKERKKDVAQMSEEEMLEMAMRNSVANGNGNANPSAPADDDPDALTRGDPGSSSRGPSALDTADMGPPPASNGTTSPPPSQPDTPFTRISSTTPHTEPTSTSPSETTRIQFRYSGGRVVRRFALSDPVRRLYEWLKAEPLDGKENVPFELISMGRNLLGEEGARLEESVEQAGLRNGTVMVEFLEGE